MPLFSLCRPEGHRSPWAAFSFSRWKDKGKGQKRPQTATRGGDFWRYHDLSQGTGTKCRICREMQTKKRKCGFCAKVWPKKRRNRPKNATKKRPWENMRKPERKKHFATAAPVVSKCALLGDRGKPPNLHFAVQMRCLLRQYRTEKKAAVSMLSYVCNLSKDEQNPNKHSYFSWLFYLFYV